MKRFNSKPDSSLDSLHSSLDSLFDTPDEFDDSDDFTTNYTPHRDTISEIIPGKLYLSDYIAASRKEVIRNHNIKRVISLGGLHDHTLYASHDGVEYLYVYIDDYDAEPIHQHFRETIDFIQEHSVDDGAVLVHCYAGISRSATIVIAYLMHTGMDFSEAYLTVKKARPVINPNDGFLCQLRNSTN